MTALKTPSGDGDPQALIETIEDERKRADAARLIHLMADATGEQPKLWGPSIIGFGSLHYRYATGRGGDTMRVGFASRKNALTLYGLQGHARSEHLLASLGTFTLGKGCVYIKRLDDIDLDVLRELIVDAYTDVSLDSDS